jgi:hypothetical protein
MCQKRVMHIWVGLYMWENRYRQFKDKKWDRTCGKRGTNQKVGPYMWENVPPNIGTLETIFARGALYLLSKAFLKPREKPSTLGVLPKIPFKLTQSIHVALQKNCSFD